MYILTPTLTLKISEEMQTLSPKSISLTHNHDSDNSSKRTKNDALWISSDCSIIQSRIEFGKHAKRIIYYDNNLNGTHLT